MAAIFVLLAIVWRQHTRSFALSAIITMLVGAVFAVATVFAGFAARGYALNVLDVAPNVAESIDEHRNSALISLFLFAGLTIAYGVAVVLPIFRKPLAFKVHVTASLLYLVVYVLALGQLAYTGSLGGSLVHGHGVLAPGHSTDTDDERPSDELTREQS
jgi:hypothetical protein